MVVIEGRGVGGGWQGFWVIRVIRVYILFVTMRSKREHHSGVRVQCHTSGEGAQPLGHMSSTVRVLCE